MSPGAREHLRYAGWRFFIPAGVRERFPHLRERLLDVALETIAGASGAPVRRSRHATSWRVKLNGARGESVVAFIKCIDPPRGLRNRAKALVRGNRAEHAARICEALRRDGFGSPRALLAGTSLTTGHQLIATEQLPGLPSHRWLNPARGVELSARRAILRALGREVARLHAKGYIHGDLTPYNVFITPGEQIAVAFIDHERTRRVSRWRPGLARRRLRNLVQLGRFDLPGTSRSDKLRVLAGYAGEAQIARRKSLRTLARMIERRRQNDLASHREGAAVETIVNAEAGGRRPLSDG